MKNWEWLKAERVRRSSGKENGRRGIRKLRIARAMAQQIFISYRRADSLTKVIKLVDYLNQYLNERRQVSIFRDEGGIVPGTNWKETLQRQIRKSDIVLVIIGPNWLSMGKSGKRRIDDSEDMVFREVQFALNQNKHIIPVLLDGVKMPLTKDLPKGIQALAGIEAQKIQIDEENTIPLLIFSAFVALALDKVKKEQYEDSLEALKVEERILESSRKESSVLSVSPEVGGSQFEGMPIYGTWHIQVTCPKGVLPGNVTLKIHFGDDFLCSGDWLVHKSFLRKHRRRVDGSWGLLPGKDSPLILKIEGMLDKSEPILFKLPIDGRMGKGYSGRDQDGRVYFFESIKGNSRPRSEVL
jgi:hypothetical protein